MRKPAEKVRTSDVIIMWLPSVAWWPNLKLLPNFSTVYVCNLAVAELGRHGLEAWIDLAPDRSVLDES